MKYGIGIPNYGETCSVESLREVAIEAEKLGYESLWVTDHILMPKNSGTPYERIFDTITSLGYLSGITRKVKLGISVLIIALRNPVTVAKQLATVDNFSNGRTMIGIGTGWNYTEFENLGSNFHNRGKRINESIQVIRALWKGEKEFSGTYTQFRDAVFEPLPIQKELEIWIGGTSIRSMQRAISLGNAWHPNVLPPPHFTNLITQFRNLAGGESKPICVRIGLNSNTDEPIYSGPGGQKRIALCANKKKNQEILDYLEKLGITYAVIVTNPAGLIPPRDQIYGIRMFADDFLR